MASAAEPILVRGQGAWVWDDHGRRFIDWVCGYGPVVLGHGDRRVAEAMYKQMLAGTLLPGMSEIEHGLRERLAGYFPCADAAIFVKTGSEAVAAAIRLARAHTRRRRVLRAGFHGWHDGLIDGKLGWHNWDNQRVPSRDVPGALPPSALEVEIATAAANSSTAAGLDTRIRSRAEPSLAAVVVDPVQLADPATELLLLRQACDSNGTLLILDETKTAFRVAMGGVQELYGVVADLTVAGKALANGAPISCVLGPADLLDAKTTRIKGTFSSERSAFAAAYATLDALESDLTCSRLSEMGRQLIARINEALRPSPVSELVQAVPYRWNAMPHIHAASDDIVAQRCRRKLVQELGRRGVLVLERHNSFVCAAHDPEDVRRTVEIVHDVADALSPDCLAEAKTCAQ